MSFKFHQNSLEKICRICINRIHPGVKQPTRKPVLCSNIRKEIYSVFGVSTWSDTPDQHPPALCEKCSRQVRHHTAGTRDIDPEKLAQNQTIQHDWPKHCRTGPCFVCDAVKQQAKGGGCHKRKTSVPELKDKSKTCSFDLTKHNIFDHFSTTSCPVSVNLDIISHKGDESIFICCICQCIVSRPAVQTACEHNFCAVCLTAYFQHFKSDNVKCPLCSSIVMYRDVTKSPRVLTVQIDNLIVVCSKCNRIGRLEQQVEHSCSPIKPSFPNVTIVKSQESSIRNHTESSNARKVTNAVQVLKDLAACHHPGTPIPIEVEEVTDRWTWLKLKRDGRMSSLKTGGRVSLLQCKF